MRRDRGCRCRDRRWSPRSARCACVTFRRAAPIAISCPTRSNSCQAGQPVDVEVGAEAQRMDRNADHGLDRRHRGEVDDRDHLGGDVREAVAVGLQHLRRPAQLGRHEAAEERLDREPALPGREVAARQLAALAADGQDVASRRHSGCRASPAARCASASGTGFSGSRPGAAGIEAGRPVLDRVFAVGRQASAPGSSRTPSSRSGLNPFTG